jgi:hypothetical protein
VHAQRAAKLVKIQYEELEPIITIKVWFISSIFMISALYHLNISFHGNYCLLYYNCIHDYMPKYDGAVNKIHSFIHICYTYKLIV